MKDRIYVRCEDRMCFWVDEKTLEPFSVSFYDAWAFSDPLLAPTMSVGEWNARKTKARERISDVERA